MMKLRIASQFIVLAAASAFVAGDANKIVRMLVLAAIVWLTTQRTTWLPFLGCAVVPTGVLAPRAPVETDFSVDIPVTNPRAIAVVYWAATVPRASDPVAAYGDYANSGVVHEPRGSYSARRSVRVYLKKPVAYVVRGGTPLRPHVHYRWVFPGGMLGAVKTVYV